MKIDLSPAVQRHLENCLDASIEVLQMKAEASYFARCLLMPEKFVRKYYSKEKHPAILAKIFAVPRKEMEYRLKELGLRIELDRKKW